MVAQGTFYRDYLPAELTCMCGRPTSSTPTGWSRPPTSTVGYPPAAGTASAGYYGPAHQLRHPGARCRSREVEEYPISILVTIMALWDMAVGAAQQHDVHTPDGVTIPISQTF